MYTECKWRRERGEVEEGAEERGGREERREEERRELTDVMA